MKKTITTLAFALAIICAAEAQPNGGRMGRNASKPSPDAKLLSTSIEGDYRVSKWLVKEKSTDENDEFSVRYRINVATMVSSYDRNSNEIAELHQFIDDLLADKQKQITKINICGYASPDGVVQSNQKLAEARARDCRTYINSKWDLAKYRGATTGVAQPWSAAIESIKESAIPNKEAVLKILESKQAPLAKEAKLRAMPKSWEYIKANILPSMRCVEIHVVYGECRVVETRTLIEPVVEEVVENVVVEQNNYFIMVEQARSNIMTYDTLDVAPIDFPLEEDRTKIVYKENRRREKIKGDIRTEYGRERSNIIQRK